MTTGTVAHFDANNGTGMLECCSGTLFPFTFRGGELAVGDRVSFVPTGGLVGLYAINVQRVEQAAVAAPDLRTQRPNLERRPMGVNPLRLIRPVAAIATSRS